MSDQGTDTEIECNDDAHAATGAKLCLQLKSGDCRQCYGTKWAAHSVSSTRKRRGDGAEIFTLKQPRHAEYWMAQAFPVLLVIRNSEGEDHWMEVRNWLKRESNHGTKPVKQIVFNGEQFDVMSVRARQFANLRFSRPPPRRWREKIRAPPSGSKLRPDARISFRGLRGRDYDLAMPPISFCLPR